MAYYKSLREYVEALDKAGKLMTISAPINKDHQLVSFVWLQERSNLPRDQYKAILFTNVVDGRGRKYDIPVVYFPAGGDFSAVALKCRPDEIDEKAANAYRHPLPPKLVKEGPVQEVVYMGNNLLAKGGMDEIPVPNAHPGWDGGPIMQTSCWVTKDLDTGIRNIGLYRSHVYAQDRTGIHIGGPEQDIQTHWQKARAKGVPLQAAIVIGGPPNLTWRSGRKMPYGVDEYTIGGALVGEPIELVKCKTIDLEVPAYADFVFEGELTTDELELEGPHGEPASGQHASMGDPQPYLKLKCISHRKDAIWLGSTPGLRGSAMAQIRDDFKLPFVLSVANMPSTAPGSNRMVAIKIKNGTSQDDVWRALETMALQSDTPGTKYFIAVNEDIDIRDADMVWWALGWRVQPHRDMRVVRHLIGHLTGVSYLPEPELVKVRHNQFDPAQMMPEASRLLINATRKWAYPPVTMPRKEFMEGALAIWKELGLPPIQLRDPWYGYEYPESTWTKQYAEDAERAVKSEYYKTSETRAKNRIKVKYPKGGTVHWPRTTFPPEKFPKNK